MPETPRRGTTDTDNSVRCADCIFLAPVSSINIFWNHRIITAQQDTAIPYKAQPTLSEPSTTSTPTANWTGIGSSAPLRSGQPTAHLFSSLLSIAPAAIRPIEIGAGGRQPARRPPAAPAPRGTAPPPVSDEVGVGDAHHSADAGVWSPPHGQKQRRAAPARAAQMACRAAVTTDAAQTGRSGRRRRDSCRGARGRVRAHSDNEHRRPDPDIILTLPVSGSGGNDYQLAQ